MKRRQEAKALCEARLDRIAERIHQKRAARGELFTVHAHSRMSDEEEEATVPGALLDALLLLLRSNAHFRCRREDIRS